MRHVCIQHGVYTRTLVSSLHTQHNFVIIYSLVTTLNQELALLYSSKYQKPPQVTQLTTTMPCISHIVLHVFSNGNKITGAYSEAETKKATIKLLRTIVVLTQTLKPLPDDVMMTMKLLYYDHGKNLLSTT